MIRLRMYNIQYNPTKNDHLLVEINMNNKDGWMYLTFIFFDYFHNWYFDILIDRSMNRFMYRYMNR